jgi:hypothetical protein
MTRYELAKDNIVLARIRAYNNGRTDIALVSGERETIHSPTLQDHLIMGQWYAPMQYIFGSRVDAFPQDAIIMIHGGDLETAQQDAAATLREMEQSCVT